MPAKKSTASLPHPSHGDVASISWLVRISEAFAPVAQDVIQRFGATSCKPLGAEYFWIRTPTPDAVRQSDAAVFARWNLPLHHTWPCNPSKTDGFLDKAARSLLQKFAPRNPQAVLIGVLNPGSPDRYFKHLAANLQDRALRIFPSLPVRSVEEQDPLRETLFGLVGKEGLYCGMAGPRECNGFFPGGSKFMPTSGPDTVSRAGAKIAEALHYLRLHRPPPGDGARWLELGACPGGMTSELLHRGFRVTAIDLAALDPRLHQHPGLAFVRANVADWQPGERERYDALLCDMNGPPRESLAHVIRLSRSLVPGSIVVFTLKLPRVESVSAPLALRDEMLAAARRGGLRLVAQTHLTCNRHEFTLFFER